MRELLDRARTTGLGGLVVSDARGRRGAAAAFLKGLTLLADRKLEPAAAAFRDAMRASADFYPAMVYLGACYAAGGKDKEAAAVWRTALIREGDTPALHVMLADALLRQGRGDLAIDDLASHAPWPERSGLQRRFAVAALVGRPRRRGAAALDHSRTARRRRAFARAGPAGLYEAFGDGQPIESVEARSRADAPPGGGLSSSRWSLHRADRCVARSRGSQGVELSAMGARMNRCFP